MAVPSVRVDGVKIEIADDRAMAIMVELQEERQTLRPRAWRQHVLCCLTCATPCTRGNACKCCDGAALNRHVRLMTADDFLVRAEARFLGGVA